MEVIDLQSLYNLFLFSGEPGPHEKIVIYTADTLGLVVAIAVLGTLIIGFAAGYLCSRYFRADNAYTNMPLHQHNR